MSGKTRDALVATVASQAHEDWRTEWRRANGDNPRVKKTTDEAWIVANGGADEVDIAATSYPDLPEDWQGENRSNAEVAVDAVLRAVTSGRVLDDAFVEATSAVVHAKWVERNNRCAEDLKVPYEGLPEAEKEKDRIVVRRTIDALR